MEGQRHDKGCVCACVHMYISLIVRVLIFSMASRTAACTGRPHAHTRARGCLQFERANGAVMPMCAICDIGATRPDRTIQHHPHSRCTSQCRPLGSLPQHNYPNFIQDIHVPVIQDTCHADLRVPAALTGGSSCPWTSPFQTKSTCR